MNYIINPIIYKLFLKLTPQEQAKFLEDMLKIEEKQND